MNFSTIINGAIRIGNDVGKVIVKHAPEIMVVSGSALVLAGGFFACKETLEAGKILDEYKEGRKLIDEATEFVPRDGKPSKYTPAIRRKDLLNLYGATAGKFVRLYWPAALCGISGFSLIFGGFGIINKRYGVAINGLAAIDSKFAKYRNNVVDTYGKDADALMAGEKLLAPSKTKEIEVEHTEIDDDGNAVTKTEKVIAIDPDSIAEEDFTFILDRSCYPFWDDSERGYLFMDNQIDSIKRHVDLMLQSHKKSHYFVNDICKKMCLHKPGNKAFGNKPGHFYGWTDSPVKGEAGLKWKVTPFIYAYDGEDDKQFPMILPLPTSKDYDQIMTYEEAQQAYDLNAQTFVNQYVTDRDECGYLIQFFVDTDENGIPREIMTQMFK